MKIRLFQFGLLTLSLSFLLVGSRVGDIELPSIPSRSFTVSAVLEEAVSKRNVFSDIDNRIKECDERLSGLNLWIGTRELNFNEERIGRDGLDIISSVKKLSDYPRQVGLCLLNKETGDLEIIQIETKIESNGVSLILPTDYEIEIVSRDNGIRWNYWNTLYKVYRPEDLVVIRNAFPIREDNVVTNFLYTPYSPELHDSEIIKIGKGYIDTIVAEAFKTLGERKVYSRSHPGQLVSDVEALKPSFFSHLPLLEQGDLTEFIFDSKNTVERTLILISLNKESAFAKTCNGVSACGWIQFTPPTYKSIRSIYKDAQLIPDFKTGAADHLNSMMSAILLYDYNLTDLIEEFGPNINNDPKLEEYLAAAYNGAPRWVHQSLTESISKNLDEWTARLKSETKGFMVKLRFLNENGY